MNLEHWIEQTNPTLIITVGISGQGKTTFTKNIQRKMDFLNINNDDLRRQIFGIDHWNEYDFDYNENIIKKLRKEMFQQFLRTKRNIILSNINLSIKHLNEYLNLAKKFGYVVKIILFDVKLSECISRNDKRKEMKLNRRVIETQHISYCKTFSEITENENKYDFFIVKE